MMTIKTTRDASLAIALLASSMDGVEPVTVPEVISIHKIEVDSATGVVTLQWSSQIGSNYAIEESTNPAFGWQERSREIVGVSPATTFSFLPQQLDDGGKNNFFRIRKMLGSDIVEKENDKHPTPNQSPENPSSKIVALSPLNEAPTIAPGGS